MSTLQEQIAVMQAFADGKRVECRYKVYSCDKWNIVVTPLWDWSSFDYQVKEEPKVSDADLQVFWDIGDDMRAEKGYKSLTSHELYQERLSRWVNKVGYKKEPK